MHSLSVFLFGHLILQLQLVQFLFLSQFCQELLGHPCRPPAIFVWFSATAVDCPWVWRRLCFKINQISWTSLLSSAKVSSLKAKDDDPDFDSAASSQNPEPTIPWSLQSSQSQTFPSFIMVFRSKAHLPWSPCDCFSITWVTNLSSLCSRELLDSCELLCFHPSRFRVSNYLRNCGEKQLQEHHEKL